jgi:hypothetical protein
MTDKRVGGMTDAEIRDLAAPRSVTCNHAAGGSIADQRNRYDELTMRSASMRSPSMRFLAGRMIPSCSA